MFGRSPHLMSLLVASTLAGALPAQTTTTLGASKDNTLYQNTSLSNGAGTRLFVGRTRQGNPNLQIRRALVAFDLSSIPSCATVTSVRVSFTVAQTLVFGQQNATLHRMNADWGEGNSFAGGGEGSGGPAANGDATWMHRFFPATTWSTPGGDFDATASATTALGSLTFPPTYFDFSSTPQLVADVQGWIDNPGSNYGWMVRSDENRSGTAYALNSKDSFEGQPRLEVTYVTAATASFGTGCTGVGGTQPLTATANGLPTFPNPGFAVNLTGGPPAIAYGLLITAARLPGPLPFGSPGCSLLVNPFPVGVVVVSATSTVPLPIPSLSPGSACETLPIQGFAVDTTTALAFSNGIDLTFGQ